MRKTLSPLVVATMLGWAGAVYAGDFQKGLETANAGDYATAFREWRDLADGGMPLAQFGLGVMYDEGLGVTQDYAEAMKWYRLAAEQGHAKAQSNLGVMYGEGQGVAQDYISAHMWLNIAAASGNEIAEENRDIVASRMTSEDIFKAQQRAREWMEKHPRQ